MPNNNTFIYGFHAVLSFLSKRSDRVDYLMVDSQRQDARIEQLIALASSKNIAIKRSNRKALNALVAGNHQGMVASIRSLSFSQDLGAFLENLAVPFLLILDGIQDPHNLGACLRTANAAGVDAVIAPKDRAAGITPVVVKIASGALLNTPFFQVTNLARTLGDLKERGVWLFGTSEHAEDLYTEVDLTGPVAIIMGSEGKGLRQLTEKHCDYLIKIPMQGSVTSLNVSVATGICLFEVVRQNYEKKITAC
jgi:23S rRNA (guanosine2251-2'-O)-methyltransferase